MTESERRTAVSSEKVPDARGSRSREKILAAAEEIFGKLGFEGGTLRMVADTAAVPVALVSHHFGNKAGLYRAVFVARAPSIIEQRMAGLHLADLEPDPRRKLELIVRSILLPMLRLKGSDQGRYFGMLLAREKADPRAGERGIVRDFFDPVAHAVIDRLKAALPPGNDDYIHWAYHVIAGAMVYVMADSGRISTLSGGAADPENAEAAVTQLTSLITRGLADPLKV